MVDNSLTLVIEACDSGLPKMCTDKSMTIRVTDVNDNSPTFTQAVYTASVSETAEAGHVFAVDGVAQVSGSFYSL